MDEKDETVSNVGVDGDDSEDSDSDTSGIFDISSAFEMADSVTVTTETVDGKSVSTIKCLFAPDKFAHEMHLGPGGLKTIGHDGKVRKYTAEAIRIAHCKKRQGPGPVSSPGPPSKRVMGDDDS